MGLIDSYLYHELEPGQRPPLRGGWFYPGDLGVLHADGMLSITGRTSEKINFRGAKVAAVPVEAEIREIEGIKDACLLTLPLEEGDLLVVAVKCGDEVDLDRLHLEIKERELLKWQFTLVRVEGIPRNPTGKIMRRPFAERLTARYKRRVTDQVASGA